MINTIATAPLADYKLPALYIALNDLLMEQVFNADPAFLDALQLVGPVSVEHELLKYAAGKRCVVAYYLHEVKSGRCIKVIGKLYRENRGQHIFQQMRQLWETRHRNHGQALMAKPLYYLPQLGIILQQEVTGAPLSTMQGDAALATAIVSAGKNLAILHETHMPGLTVRERMAEHIHKYCRPLPTEIARTSPGLSEIIRAILDGLLADSTLFNSPLSTVHNDLNPHHIYWSHSRTFFIDFDGICLSHAALDLANFKVALQLYFGDEGVRLGRRFQNVYLETRGLAQIEGLALYEAFVYLRRATICYRKQATPDWYSQTEWLLNKSWAALTEKTAVFHTPSFV